jgi:hypothetical protein
MVRALLVTFGSGGFLFRLRRRKVGHRLHHEAWDQRSGVGHRSPRGMSGAPRLHAIAFAMPGLRVYSPSVMWRLGKEFLLFLRQEKKWWLVPVGLVLLLLAALILFSSSSVLAPFMYPFM